MISFQAYVRGYSRTREPTLYIRAVVKGGGSTGGYGITAARRRMTEAVDRPSSLPVILRREPKNLFVTGNLRHRSKETLRFTQGDIWRGG